MTTEPPLPSKTAAVLVIGNEMLTGRTQDSNLVYISKKLAQIGIRMRHGRVIADEEAEIITHLNALREKYDYVFTTGGIGPTHDDITALSIAKAFAVPLELNSDAFDRLVQHYGGAEHVNEARQRMAMIPQGASLIDNPVSASPGFHLGNVFVFAGVPRIAQAMMDNVLPHLQGGPPILSRSVGSSLTESVLAKDLAALAKDYPDLEIGSYPYFRPSGYGLSLVIRGIDATRLEEAVEDVCAMIKHLGGEATLLTEG